VRTAFELARTGRPGPVVIDIPKDIQNWEGEFTGVGSLPLTGYRHRLQAVIENHLTDDACERFYKMLAESERPLIYAGGGVINGNATKAMRHFASAYGIPVATTLMALGASDTKHPLSLHMLGMHGMAFANYAVEDCDLLVTIGARFDDRVAGDPVRFAPKAKNIAHFDIDVSEIGKVKSVDWHHVGILKRDLDDLLAYGKRIKFEKEFTVWHKEIAGLKEKHCLNYDRESDLIQPYAVIEEINRLAGGKAIISTGVGQHQMWAAQYFDFREPRLWLTSGSMGTMGFGLPAAIGAQVAKPDRLVIDIDGDGSMRMNIGELETATTYGLPIKVIVLNNFGDGMVRQRQVSAPQGLRQGGRGRRIRIRGEAGSKRRPAGRHQRIYRVLRPCVPRSHYRPRRRRLSHGRSRPELRQNDHGRLYRQQRPAGRRQTRPQRNVLIRIVSPSRQQAGGRSVPRVSP